MPFTSNLTPFQLFARTRAIIRMRDEDKMSFREIGDIFCISDALAHQIYKSNQKKNENESKENTDKN